MPIRSTSSSTILGIDPGSLKLGLSLIQAGSEIKVIFADILELPPQEKFHRRLLILGQKVRELLQKFRPDDVVVERAFFAKDPESAFKLGQVRGVLFYEALQAQARIFEYTPRAVKKSITGNGASSKEEVAFVLQKQFRLKNFASLDASDALALCLFHSFERQKNQMLKSERIIS